MRGRGAYGGWLGGAMSVALAVAPVARAQTWQSLTGHRALGADDSLRVVVKYGLGKLTLRAAAPATLYDVSMRYDADVFRPEKSYDAATHTLTVGADSATAERFSLRPRFSSHSGHQPVGEMTLGLARGIPLNVTVKAGVATSDIDLGDLWVDQLRVEAAMGEATVRFTTLNPHPMKELSIDAALGGVSVKRLGNARAQRVSLNAVLGGIDADLSGTWTSDMTVDAKAALGGLDLRVPRDVGVVIHASTVLGALGSQGFVRRSDGAYYSANYASATRKITVNAKAVLGGVDVNWVDQ